MKKEKVNVTKTYIPPLNEYIAYLNRIWNSNWLTNHGPLVNELERKLKGKFNVKHCYFVSNGTIALQIAIKALGLSGEIITTPFSYIATSSTIAWEGCKPVFVDIEPDHLTIDAKKIESAISKRTCAILTTHVYGNPCDVEKIGIIAKKNNLKVIYDAAHCFGITYKNTPIFNYGDISTLSFHATKLFHTVEGGAILTNNDNLAQKISFMRNFGHKGEEQFWGLGINAKNSEFHAAMGLCILPRVSELIKKRKKKSQRYDELLFKKSTSLKKICIRKNTLYNYSYYPVIFKNEESLFITREELNRNSIFPRRYFYPSLSSLDYISKQKMPVSEDIARRILCLPLYHDLSIKHIELISKIINRFC